MRTFVFPINNSEKSTCVLCTSAYYTRDSTVDYTTDYTAMSSIHTQCQQARKTWHDSDLMRLLRIIESCTTLGDEVKKSLPFITKTLNVGLNLIAGVMLASYQLFTDLVQLLTTRLSRLHFLLQCLASTSRANTSVRKYISIATTENKEAQLLQINYVTMHIIKKFSVDNSTQL